MDHYYRELFRQHYSRVQNKRIQDLQRQEEVALCKKQCESARKQLAEAKESRNRLDQLIEQVNAPIKFQPSATTDPEIEQLNEKIKATKEKTNELMEQLNTEPSTETQVALAEIMQKISIADEKKRRLQEENLKNLEQLIRRRELKRLKKQAQEQEVRLREVQQVIQDRAQPLDDVKMKIENGMKVLNALEEEVRQEHEYKRRLLDAQEDEELFEQLRLEKKREAE